MAANLVDVAGAKRRGQGNGAGMLQVAEAEAIRRGCQYAYVDTMDYQAPEFYQRLSYTIAGQLDDWDSHGHAKLFLVKSYIDRPGQSPSPPSCVFSIRAHNRKHV